MLALDIIYYCKWRAWGQSERAGKSINAIDVLQDPDTIGQEPQAISNGSQEFCEGYVRLSLSLVKSVT